MNHIWILDTLIKRDFHSRYKFDIQLNYKKIKKTIKNYFLPFSSLASIPKYSPQKYKPTIIIHGDDWKEGVQQDTRGRVIDALKKWGGQLVEVPRRLEAVPTGAAPVKPKAAAAPTKICGDITWSTKMKSIFTPKPASGSKIS